MSEIVTMLLASLPGDGFTGSRWLAPWGDGTLLGHALEVAASWPVPLGVVVLGADAEDLVDRIEFGDVVVLVDPEWREGEAASLRAGLDYLQRQQDVETVLLADAATPTLPPEVVPALLQAHAMSDRPATAPKFRYLRERPLLLDRELWPRFLGLEGGADPMAVLATRDRWVEEVWFDQLAPAKVASPQDLDDLAPRR